MVRPDVTWHERAACRDAEPEAFFPVYGATRRDTKYVIEAYCENCPVQRRCLNAALSLPTRDQYGIWGGTTPEQRSEMLRRGQAA